MAVRTSHLALTLRGNRLQNGITVSGGQVLFSPNSGMMRHDAGLLACACAPDGDLEKVHVAVTEYGTVLVPCEDVSQRELVLVQQYSNGSGSKRWPSFSVEFGPEVRILSKASTSGGSGSEHWVLISAPLGWAENIASQFVNERDYGGQTISYRNVPEELLISKEAGTSRSGLADALRRAGLL